MSPYGGISPVRRTPRECGWSPQSLIPYRFVLEVGEHRTGDDLGMSLKGPTAVNDRGLTPTMLHLSTLTPKTRIRVTADLICLKPGDIRVVQRDKDGELYITCRGPDGRGRPNSCHHNLDGLRADFWGGKFNDSLIGLEKAP